MNWLPNPIRTWAEGFLVRFADSPLARNRVVVLACRVSREMIGDDATHLAAGISYFAIFSLFPILLGCPAIAGVVLDSEEVKKEFEKLNLKARESKPKPKTEKPKKQRKTSEQLRAKKEEKKKLSGLFKRKKEEKGKEESLEAKAGLDEEGKKGEGKKDIKKGSNPKKTSKDKV